MELLAKLKIAPSYSPESIRGHHLSRLKDDVYLDHAGTALYGKGQLDNVMAELSSTVLGNPHSRNRPSDTSTQIMHAARQKVLGHFNTSEEEYSVIFTSGATAAIKLVAENFPWSGGCTDEYQSNPGCYVYTKENHTSVLGVRACASKLRASVVSLTTAEVGQIIAKSADESFIYYGEPYQGRQLATSQEQLIVNDVSEKFSSDSNVCNDGVSLNLSSDVIADKKSNMTTEYEEIYNPFHVKSENKYKSTVRNISENEENNLLAQKERDTSISTGEKCKNGGKQRVCPGLFAYSAQCNYSGAKYPLEWVSKVQKGAFSFCAETNTIVAGSSTERSTRRWFVLLDAASLVATSPLDLSKCTPDFVPISFYKMFGYPTGLGCLLVHRRARSMLGKTYFGGGTVELASSDTMQTVLRSDPHDRYEDGTAPFLAIAALRHGFEFLALQCGDIEVISRHVSQLARYVHHSLLSYRHSNGTPVARIYAPVGHWTIETRGSIVNFNVLTDTGECVGYTYVERVATLYNIHLRTGCVCNPGACQLYLDISSDALQQQHKAGHICGDTQDIVNGRPTGSVRISFGYSSSYDDADTFLQMIRDCFVSGPLLLETDWMIEELREIGICNQNHSDENLIETHSIGGNVLQHADDSSNKQFIGAHNLNRSEINRDVIISHRTSKKYLEPKSDKCFKDINTEKEHSRNNLMQLELKQTIHCSQKKYIPNKSNDHFEQNSIIAENDQSTKHIEQALSNKNGKVCHNSAPFPNNQKSVEEEEIKFTDCNSTQTKSTLNPSHQNNSHQTSDSALQCEQPNKSPSNKLVNLTEMYNRQQTNKTIENIRTIEDTSPTSVMLTNIRLYPVKSCGAMTVQSWSLNKRGLLYDRHWMIVSRAGYIITQKRQPSMSLITPMVDLESGALTLSHPDYDSVSIAPHSLEINPQQNQRNHQQRQEHQQDVKNKQQDEQQAKPDEKLLLPCNVRLCGDSVEGVDCGEQVAEWLTKVLGVNDIRLFRQSGLRKSKKNSPDGSLANSGVSQQQSLANEAPLLLLHRPSVARLAANIRNNGRETAPATVADLLDRFRGNLIFDGGKEFEEDDWTALQSEKIALKVEGVCQRCQMVAVDPRTGHRTLEPLLTLKAMRPKQLTFGVLASFIGKADVSENEISCETNARDRVSGATVDNLSTDVIATTDVRETESGGMAVATSSSRHNMSDMKHATSVKSEKGKTMVDDLLCSISIGMKFLKYL
uniref:Molybdenum cofactor sulfurase n=2 Tax=Hirondellea gigas TaxID=1518452 RepID=A0A6A7G9P1_9CRUS